VTKRQARKRAWRELVKMTPKWKSLGFARDKARKKARG